MNIVQLPHQLSRIGNGSLGLELTWHVSKSHSSFSLLTLVPFSQMKRKKIWIHDASLLSEMVTWLSAIPEGIIHQKLLCHHHQQRAEAQVSLPSPNPSSSCSHPLFVCFVQHCSHLSQHARSRCVRAAEGHRDHLSNRPVHNFEIFSAIFISSPSNV